MSMIEILNVVCRLGKNRGTGRSFGDIAQTLVVTAYEMDSVKCNYSNQCKNWLYQCENCSRNSYRVK